MKNIDITGLGLERRQEDNPFNYTEDQLTEKKIALKMMKELWSDVPDTYASWVYDLCKNTEEDKLKEMMEKIDNTPSRFRGLEDVKRLKKEQEERMNKNKIVEINN
jgi:hypothetical protein